MSSELASHHISTLLKAMRLLCIGNFTPAKMS